MIVAYKFSDDTVIVLELIGDYIAFRIEGGRRVEDICGDGINDKSQADYEAIHGKVVDIQVLNPSDLLPKQTPNYPKGGNYDAKPDYFDGTKWIF